jgi:hypothetical protein
MVCVDEEEMEVPRQLRHTLLMPRSCHAGRGTPRTCLRCKLTLGRSVANDNKLNGKPGRRAEDLNDHKHTRVRSFSVNAIRLAIRPL